MDPITQAVLGATYSQALIQKKSHHLYALIFGILSGMAPDLDVLIFSKTDSLLFLEYHRQFTHSLFFIPFGALLCSIIFYLCSLKKIHFKWIYLYSFLGYATHGLLDACTSYGTQLFWPFSSIRISWNIISIIDPIYTLPLIIFSFLTFKKKNKRFAYVSIIYGLLYLSLGLIQRNRAIFTSNFLAKERNHYPIKVEAKPSFGNLLLWKIFYEYQGKYYVDAVKLTINKKIFKGSSIYKYIQRKDLPWLKKNSKNAKDIERFRWFSDGYIALNPYNKNQIIDIRYSMIPNQIKPIWGIDLTPNNQNKHVEFKTYRNINQSQKNAFLDMLF